MSIVNSHGVAKPYTFHGVDVVVCFFSRKQRLTKVHDFAAWFPDPIQTQKHNWLELSSNNVWTAKALTIECQTRASKPFSLESQPQTEVFEEVESRQCTNHTCKLTTEQILYLQSQRYMYISSISCLSLAPRKFSSWIIWKDCRDPCMVWCGA